MNGVYDERHLGGARRNPAEHACLALVGVDDIWLQLAVQAAKITNRSNIVERTDRVLDRG
jgi:hypothetical protein